TTITLPVVLVMRNVECPSQSTSICAARTIAPDSHKTAAAATMIDLCARDTIGSEANRLARLDLDDLDRCVTKRRLELRRRAVDHGNRPVVHGDRLLRGDIFAKREGGPLRIHRKMPADAHERQIRLVAAADERHVAENVGVTAMVDLESVLQ